MDQVEVVPFPGLLVVVPGRAEVVPWRGWQPRVAAFATLPSIFLQALSLLTAVHTEPPIPFSPVLSTPSPSGERWGFSA